MPAWSRSTSKETYERTRPGIASCVIVMSSLPLVAWLRCLVWLTNRQVIYIFLQSQAQQTLPSVRDPRNQLL